METTMERTETMNQIARELTEMIEKYTSNHRKDVRVEYCHMNADKLSTFEWFDRQRFDLFANKEYLMIWKTEDDEVVRLLYTVPVTDDPPLVAIESAVHLISWKFF